MFTLQSAAILDNVKLFSGSDIAVFSFSSDYPLDYEAMTEYLTERKKNSTFGIESFSFVTFPLFYHHDVESTNIASLSEYRPIPITVYGVDNNFLDSTYNKYVVPGTLDKSFNYKKTSSETKDVIRNIYDHKSTPEQSNYYYKQAKSDKLKLPNPTTLSFTILSMNETTMPTKNLSLYKKEVFKYIFFIYYFFF
jgi:hypothetical protein